jgi:hypothetical protein
MTPQSPQTPEEIKQLVASGLDAATWIPQREALERFLIEPHVRSLKWPYANPVVEFPCWSLRTPVITGRD